MENDTHKDESKGHPSPPISQNQAAEISKVKKVVINEITNSVITNLPPELSEMMKAARQANNKSENISAAPDTPKKPSSEVEHSEGKKKVVINELTNSVITNLPPELTEMLRAARQANNKKDAASTPTTPVKAVPPPPPKDPNALVIDETGSIFGLQVNVATRREVLERMKALSKINISSPGESIFKYDDLGIAFYFGENGALQEITFAYPFSGITLKGLRIEDPIKKAIDLYGPPKMQTPAGAIWDKFAVF